jgi:Tfp pilus assembly protein PilV
MSDHLREESGITLIELLISIILLGIIIVPLTGAMIDGINSTTASQKRLSESRSPMFTNAYFAQDAQSASADANGVTYGGSFACGTGDVNVVSFSWSENGTPYSSSYVLVTTGGKTVLKRNYCVNNNANTIVVAPILGGDAGCGQPACAMTTSTDPRTSRPRTIQLTASTPNGESTFFTLTATRRAT